MVDMEALIAFCIGFIGMVVWMGVLYLLVKIAQANFDSKKWVAGYLFDLLILIQIFGTLYIMYQFNL